MVTNFTKYKCGFLVVVSEKAFGSAISVLIGNSANVYNVGQIHEEVLQL